MKMYTFITKNNRNWNKLTSLYCNVISALYVQIKHVLIMDWSAEKRDKLNDTKPNQFLVQHFNHAEPQHADKRVLSTSNHMALTTLLS